MTWREELHPRDEAGRFARKNSLSAVSIKNTLANLHMASDDELLDVFGRLSRAKRLRTKDFLAIDAELTRRDNPDGPGLPEPDPSPEQARVDQLVGRGWSYADAYAEVYEASTGRGDEHADLVDKRKGETREQAVRRSYAELVALQALQAEEATRGNLVRPGCRGIDPIALWSGRADRARKCASEELARWWEENGGRKNYTQYKAELTGGSAGRRRSRATAGAGSGRDFGL